jgi:hypothetical protein
MGILPLVEERRLWTGRTLVNVGSGKACLDDLGIVSNSDRSAEVAQRFADYLLTSSDLPWDYLDLDGIRTTDTAMHAFAETFKRRNPNCMEHRASPSCWAVDIRVDANGIPVWSKNLRKIMRKARDERESGELEFRIARDVDDARQELKVLESIHQARWNDRGVQGCFSSESFSNFAHDLIGRTCGAGRSFVAVLRWMGTPAAAGICFIDSTTLYIYLASMSPEFPMQKPGWKLNGFLGEYALQQGCRRLDFMRGDEEYKQRFGATPSSQERWLISSPKLRGQIHRKLYRTAREIKHLIMMPAGPTCSNQPAADL